MKFVREILLAVSIIAIPIGTSAQIRALGFLSSLTMGGIQADFESSERAFHSLVAAVNLDRHFGQTDSPGFFLNYDYCFNVFSFSNGPGTFSFLFGPGVETGWLDNSGPKSENGFVLAVDASFAIEYEFFRGVIIGLRTSPSFGFHIQKTIEYPSMTLYKSGLLQGGVPQISLKYRFL